jgi:GT2 family glycosyltransferase
MSGLREITISLISLNQKPDLERLLPTLMPAAEKAGAEVLLVNNRSTDGTGAFMTANYPAVSVVDNPRLAGYGENHNINLKRATGRYFVIMNSDMTVTPGTFTVLKDYLDAHPDVGAACPKILNPDGSIQGLNKRYPTVWDLFLRRFMPRPLRGFFKRRMDAYEMRDVGYDHSYDVPAISGCFMFCRADVLRNIGGFNEKYFMYFEDTDLCRRIQYTHRTVYYPGAEVTHFWARSAHLKFRYMLYFFGSAFRYFNKWGYKLF